jgi:tetratricopeptide (TPR) repeat protein
MSEHPSKKRPRRVNRHWRVPPALLRSPTTPEAFEGASILSEFRGDTGFALWQGYRDVLLWASTPPEGRAGLFHDGGGDLGSPEASEPSLVERLDVDTLRALRRLRRGALQQHGDDGSMVAAAMAVAVGAERRGAAATSVAYAQLSAAIDPSSASASLAVGRLALRLDHAPVADTWLRRTIALARRSRDWESYAAALAALGQFREQKNRLDDAHGEYIKALRASRRWGLQDTMGHAVSGLLRVALRQEDQEAAERYVVRALRIHRRGHPRHASVLVDAAEVELRRGAHARAEEMLRTALPGLAGAEELRALILLVRALGGIGEGQGVGYAWHRALDVIDDEYGCSGEAVRSLLTLAHAGAELLQELHADRAAQRAHACATQIGDEELIAACDAFLARARFPRAA